METVSDKEIEERVRDVVVEVLRVDPGKVLRSSAYKEDLGVDSLDTVTLLMALEEAFDSEITDDEAETLTTVDATVEFIKAKLAQKV